MRSLRTGIRYWALALLCLWSPWPLAGDDFARLQEAGQVTVAAAVAPEDNIVPGQKVTLTLEIATDRWFTGGTRIRLPEVPGLVILQTEQFASNASENRAGRSWVIQRWSLDVYPQRAGGFTVPPIAARVKVDGGEDGEIQGELLSPAVAFTVVLPDSLAAADRWVAAPDFALRQSFSRSLEGLSVGDAFEREILFEAGDVMAMMLPAIEAEDIPGLAAYPSPPVLENSNNRGESRARRSQRITYVVQAGGRYRLPGRDFYWWDTGSGELRLLTLPATDITVGAAADSAGEADGRAAITPRQLLAGAAGLTLLGVMLWLARTILSRLPLAPVRAACAGAWQALRDLRKPALPQRLNPGSSAGE